MDEEDRIKKVKKLASLETEADFTIYEELEDIGEKVEAIESKLSSDIDGIREELKKKFDSELNFEIDPEEIRGPAGRDGEVGKDGKNGRDGRDGRDGIDGRDGKDGVDGIQGPKGEQGEIGPAGSPDTPQDIRNKLEELDGEDRLDKEAVKGLEDFALADDLDKLRDYFLERLKKIRIWGGGQSTSSSSSTLPYETPTGTINGTNRTFTVTNEPKALVIDGVTKFVNNGTTDNPSYKTFTYTGTGPYTITIAVGGAPVYQLRSLY